MGKPNLHIGYFAGFAVEITGVVKGYSMAEYIGFRKRTRGSETSQYPQERTSTETPLVVASERGPGQWLLHMNRNILESLAVVGDSPVRVSM